jgi:hypothetical protein
MDRDAMPTLFWAELDRRWEQACEALAVVIEQDSGAVESFCDRIDADPSTTLVARNPTQCVAVGRLLQAALLEALARIERRRAADGASHGEFELCGATSPSSLYGQALDVSPGA